MRDVTKQELEERWATDAAFRQEVDRSVATLERVFGQDFGDNRSLAALTMGYALLAGSAAPTQEPEPDPIPELPPEPPAK